MTSVVNYVRRRPKEKLNILTFPTHQTYETELAKTGHNFYAFHVPQMGTFEDYGLENYHLMKSGDFYPYNDYDLILSQNRFGQFNVAQKLNSKLQIPVITLEHTTPTPDLSTQALTAMGRMEGDVNIFISEHSRHQWSNLGINRSNNVIRHCVDTKVFQPIQPREGYFNVLTVANDFKARDYCLNYSLWEEVNDLTLNLQVIGKNSNQIRPDFIELPHSELLVEAYSTCGAYLNTTSHSPIPMSLLEAMACECPIVTTSTCGIPEFIEDGVNGLLADTAEDIAAALNRIERDPDFGKKLGKAARQTILTSCSSDRFVREWNEIFTKTYEASL